MCSSLQLVGVWECYSYTHHCIFSTSLLWSPRFSKHRYCFLKFSKIRWIFITTFLNVATLKWNLTMCFFHYIKCQLAAACTVHHEFKEDQISGSDRIKIVDTCWNPSQQWRYRCWPPSFIVVASKWAVGQLVSHTPKENTSTTLSYPTFSDLRTAVICNIYCLLSKILK